MTNPTTRTLEPGAAGPEPVPTPVNGKATGDVRTLRHASRAEQERLSADAEVDRRARAARLDLELREQRRAAARRQRHADEQDKRAQAEQRRSRRAASRSKLRATAPRWAETALFVLPIMFPMAVAWVGQIRFAMSVMGWPLPAAIVFAAGFELSTAYVARLDWRSRAAGDSAVLFRVATWGFAAGAAVMNYWHAAGPDLAPTGEAVSYGLMSVTGVVLWELLSTYRHRTALRAEGKLPAARPRFGLARWIWFRPLTRLAWLIALRDGYTTTELAWRAAIGAVDLYGSARAARKAVRLGRPVPRPRPLDAEQRDEDQENQRDEGVRDSQPRHDVPDLAPRDTPTRDERRDDTPEHPDSAEPDRIDDESADPDTGPLPVPPAQASVDRPAEQGDRDSTTRDAAADRSEVRQDDAGQAAVGTKMLAYARQRLAQGEPVTGADLDRQFGTRDYGRKVLRRLAIDASGSPR